jgi:hypothetical protein
MSGMDPKILAINSCHQSIATNMLCQDPNADFQALVNAALCCRAPEEGSKPAAAPVILNNGALVPPVPPPLFPHCPPPPPLTSPDPCLPQKHVSRIPSSPGGLGVPVLVPTLFWVGGGSLPCCLAESPQGFFFTRFGFTSEQLAFRRRIVANDADRRILSLPKLAGNDLAALTMSTASDAVALLFTVMLQLVHVFCGLFCC